MPMNFAEEHGGNIHRASEVLGRGIHEILDFSANINPLGIPRPLKEALIANIDAMMHYPDPEYRRLRSRLSDYTGVPSGSIIPGNGSSELIFLLLRTLKPKDILIPAPSFSEYEKAAADAGIAMRVFELREEEGFRLNTERLTRELSAGIECVLLCNPNNPTSTLISYEEMALIVEHARRCGTMVIIDEAFIELTVGGASNSVVDLVKRYDNLFIIRAFTKVFAVPGMRLGYGVGGEELVARMRLKQQPWSVNSLAACAGDFLAGAGEYLHRTSAWLAKEKEWLCKGLSGIRGVEAFRPDSNFVLVRLPDAGPDAGTLKDRMAKRGVLIRDASNFRFLSKRYIRVAVRDRASNRRLVEALREEML